MFLVQTGPCSLFCGFIRINSGTQRRNSHGGKKYTMLGGPSPLSFSFSSSFFFVFIFFFFLPLCTTGASIRYAGDHQVWQHVTSFSFAIHWPSIAKHLANRFPPKMCGGSFKTFGSRQRAQAPRLSGQSWQPASLWCGT